MTTMAHTVTESPASSADDAALLTMAEVADELRVSRRTIWRLLRRGDLAGFKVGNRVRITSSSVEDYLVSNPAVEPILTPSSTRHETRSKHARRPHPSLPSIPSSRGES